MKSLCFSSSSRRSVRRAFTLIELLTVIAIIGILAAILVPVVGKVRASAANATCKSNLRQLAVATLMYAGDNRDRLPMNLFKGVGSSYTGLDQGSLVSYIGPYLGNGPRVQPPAFIPTLTCPAHVSAKGDPATTVPTPNSSYMILNAFGNSQLNPVNGSLPPWGNIRGSASASTQPVRLSQIPSFRFRTTQNTAGTVPVSLMGQAASPSNLLLAVDFEYVAEGKVHGDSSMNASFFDGSVRSLDPITYERR